MSLNIKVEIENDIEKMNRLLGVLQDSKDKLSMILRHTISEYLENSQTPEEKNIKIQNELKPIKASVPLNNESKVLQFPIINQSNSVNKIESESNKLINSIWGKKRDDDSTGFNFPY